MTQPQPLQLEGVAAAPTPAGRSAAFGKEVHRFLRAAPFVSPGNGIVIDPRAFERHIAFIQNGAAAGGVACSRFVLRVRAPTILSRRMDVTQDMRRVFELHSGASPASQSVPTLPLVQGEYPLRGWVTSYYFMYSDRDRVVRDLIATTLTGAAVAVVAVLLLFLRVRTVLGICVCIGTIDASLFGLMAVWDIPIDVASFICLVTAIGLSVDYVVHLAHAFEHAEHAPHGSGAGAPPA